MNNVTLSGRITADPEVKQTNGGVPYVNFTVAVDRRFKSADGEKKTDFIYCSAWRQTAEFIGRWFKKGDGVALQGRIETDSYTDQNGDKRTSFKVVADAVEFPPSKKSSGDDGSRSARRDGPTDDFIPIDDGLPF